MVWVGLLGKVAVATDDPGGLDARVSDSLGDASAITVVDPSTWDVEVIPVDPGERDLRRLAGVLRGSGAFILITGLVSPIEAAELARSGVWVLPGMAGVTAREAIEAAAGTPAAGPWLPPAAAAWPQFPARYPAPVVPPRPPKYLLERQREALEFQRWVLQRQLEILDKQREILQRQLLMVKKALDELEERTE
ncbi:MAG: hypothetical protein QI223_10590 [Candidatus Korarchaeota archaeon]|nr:hypothetical protein [Candidatus Korarchaeota archaeon]